MSPTPDHPYPWKRRLPGELANQIEGLLKYNDFLPMRGVNRSSLVSTNHLLTKFFLPKLKHLDVLLTRDGLLTLRGLLSNQRWKNEIQYIKLIDHGLYTLRQHPSRPPCRDWLGHLPIDPESKEFSTMVKTTIPAQQAFEKSGEALAILTDIFRDLQSACSLKEVNLGIKRSHHPRTGFNCEWGPRPRVMGLHRMLKSIGFPNYIVELTEFYFVSWQDRRDSGVTFLPARDNLACRAIRQSGFDKQIIRVEIDSQYPSPTGLVTFPSFRSPQLPVALTDGDT
jgi:hypothetical protein